MLKFTLTKHAQWPMDAYVGNIVTFASEENNSPLRDQFDKNYGFGGGWMPFEGFTFNPKDKSLTYPDDPPLLPMAVAKFRNQEVIIYNHAWVAIAEEDGSVEVSRMD